MPYKLTSYAWEIFDLKVVYDNNISEEKPTMH